MASFFSASSLTVFLAGCGQEELSTLLPAGQVGRDQFNLLLLSSAIMLLVIIVVIHLRSCHCTFQTFEIRR